MCAFQLRVIVEFLGLGSMALRIGNADFDFKNRMDAFKADLKYRNNGLLAPMTLLFAGSRRNQGSGVEQCFAAGSCNCTKTKMLRVSPLNSFKPHIPPHYALLAPLFWRGRVVVIHDSRLVNISWEAGNLQNLSKQHPAYHSLKAWNPALQAQALGVQKKTKGGLVAVACRV